MDAYAKVLTALIPVPRWPLSVPSRSGVADDDSSGSGRSSRSSYRRCCRCEVRRAPAGGHGVVMISTEPRIRSTSLDRSPPSVSESA
jgi:hypothetical protein